MIKCLNTQLFFNHKNKFFLLFNGNNYGKTGVGLVEMKYEKKKIIFL